MELLFTFYFLLFTLFFQPVIGLEIHVHLKTKSKMFCGCNADIWPSFAKAPEGKQAAPNTHVCPVCLGLPGALPTINKKAVDYTIMMGLALNCSISKFSFFERKNYFYPDLPKGYQISQYRAPFARCGWLKIKSKKHARSKVEGSEIKKVRINRVHLEEDVAKLIHEIDPKTHEHYSLLDFNKSGIPLMEIVSEPDITSSKEAVSYSKKIQQIVRYLGISDGDIEKGQMRFEVNISLRQGTSPACRQAGNKRQEKLPPYRVEIKNINSFRHVALAIEYEIKRQSELLEKGKKLVQETRGFDEEKEITFSQREKEEAHDYRYFPEPDLPPIHLDQEWIEQIKSQMTELPDQKEERFVRDYQLQDDQIRVLLDDQKKSNYFEEVVRLGIDPKETANLVINKPELLKLLPRNLVGKIRKEKTEKIEDEEQLAKVIQEVIAKNSQPVIDYQSGKKEAIKFLMGQVMRATRGRASPQLAEKLLKEFLS